MGKHLLFADPSGELKAFVGEPRPGLRQLAGCYRIAVETPDLLILHREDRSDLEHTEGEVLMAGQIVAASTVLEVVSTIVASRWIGTLHVYGSDSQRRLGFYKGMLRHAESDMPRPRDVPGGAVAPPGAGAGSLAPDQPAPQGHRRLNRPSDRRAPHGGARRRPGGRFAPVPRGWIPRPCSSRFAPPRSPASWAPPPPPR
jgi:hypothetical protein